MGLSPNDKHFLKEFVVGVTFGLVPAGLFIVFVASNSPKEPPPEGVEPPRFGVIDKYKGCDVVRFAPPNGAEYAYFLDCRKVR